MALAAFYVKAHRLNVKVIVWISEAAKCAWNLFKISSKFFSSDWYKLIWIFFDFSQNRVHNKIARVHSDFFSNELLAVLCLFAIKFMAIIFSVWRTQGSGWKKINDFACQLFEINREIKQAHAKHTKMATL